MTQFDRRGAGQRKALRLNGIRSERSDAQAARLMMHNRHASGNLDDSISRLLRAAS